MGDGEIERGREIEKIDKMGELEKIEKAVGNRKK